MKLLSSLTKPQPVREAADAAAAADWTCLNWLLQNASEEVVTKLQAEWQKHQRQEFATWVRPAAELNAVRSKTAAKVNPQHFL